MYNITLVASRHVELGKCNAIELCKIIEKINPEIIFEEIPWEKYDAYYKEKSHYTLETKAINIYSQYYQVKHIPVDTYGFSDVMGRMDYNKLSENGEGYEELLKEQYLKTYENGFLYINSKELEKLFEKLYVIEGSVIEKLNDENLSRIYKLWREIHDNRENEIIKNIYDYSFENKYNNALLLIGAEHKKSLIEKIKKHQTQEKIKLNWKLYGI